MSDEVKTDMTETQPKKRRGRRATPKTIYEAVTGGSGRPPKNPTEKLKLYVRFTCNKGFKEIFQQAAKKRDMNESDYLRLAAYNQMRADGLLDDAFARNPTWETLWNQGVVPMPTRGPLTEEE